MSNGYDLKIGSGPLLISVPHSGTKVPDHLAARMTSVGQACPDTDWQVDQLYGFVRKRADITLVKANWSRYVVDLNRSPDGKPLYPGANETSLCPITSFDHEPIYLDRFAPDGAEIEHRRRKYWQPYHSELGSQLARIKAEFGYALLWDAHSIASHVPRFFSGRLPDYSFGTADSSSCPQPILEALTSAAAQRGLECVANQRFKGGYITRHYGDPTAQVFAVQLELSQRCYWDQRSHSLDGRSSGQTAAHIAALIEAYLLATQQWLDGSH